jgi:predicted PurR-regulated permease PerM
MAEAFARLWNHPRFRRNFMITILWMAMIGTLYAVREVLLPFLIALALAYVIDPGIRRINQRKFKGKPIPRWAGVLIIYVVIFAIGWILTVFFVPQLYRELSGLARGGATYLNEMDEERIEELSKRVEEYSTRMRLPVDIITSGDLKREKSQSPKGPLQVDVIAGAPVLNGDESKESGNTKTGDEIQDPSVTKSNIDQAAAAVVPHLQAAPEGSDAILTIRIDEIARALLQQGTNLLQTQTTQIVGQLQVWFARTVGFVFSIFVVLMITAFISSDTKRVTSFFFSIIPIEDTKTFDDFLQRLDYGLSGVVRGQITICLVNGFLTLIGLMLLKVKFALLLATVATIFSLIPIFGSILSTIPIVLVSLISGAWTAFFSLLWIIGIHFVEANFLNPKIMGDAAKIHPVVIILSLVAGEHFYGLAGALFAVPLVSMSLTAFRSIQMEVQSIEKVLANAPVQSDVKEITSYRPRRRRIWREL